MSLGFSLTFPSLSIDVEPKLNPNLEVVEGSIWKWVRTFDLIRSSAAHRSFTSAQIWNLAARCFPDFDTEDLCLAGDWLTFMHIQSAQFAEARIGRAARRHQAYVDEAIKLLREPRLATVRNDGALLAALSALWARTQARVSEEMAIRFISVFASYLTGYLAATENRRLNFLPSMSEYIGIRRTTGGFRIFSLLAEMALEKQLTQPMNECPDVALLHYYASDGVSWMHDLYRMERFASRNDNHHIVEVIRQEMKLLPQEAIDEVASRIDGMIDDFMVQYRMLKSRGDVVSTYADSLASIVRGMYDWVRLQEHPETNSHHVRRIDS